MEKSIIWKISAVVSKLKKYYEFQINNSDPLGWISIFLDFSAFLKIFKLSPFYSRPKKHWFSKVISFYCRKEPVLVSFTSSPIIYYNYFVLVHWNLQPNDASGMWNVFFQPESKIVDLYKILDSYSFKKIFCAFYLILNMSTILVGYLCQN